MAKKRIEISIEKLAHAAGEINELLELDDANKILDNVKKYNAEKANEVREELLEASAELSKGDEVSETTDQVLQNLGSKAKYAVKIEKKEKPAAEKKKSPTPVKSNNKGKGWREGSSADIIHQAVIKAGAKGATAEQIEKKVDGKFDTANITGRVATVLKEAVKRGLIKVDDKGKYSEK